MSETRQEMNTCFKHHEYLGRWCLKVFQPLLGERSSENRSEAEDGGTGRTNVDSHSLELGLRTAAGVLKPFPLRTSAYGEA